MAAISWPTWTSSWANCPTAGPTPSRCGTGTGSARTISSAWPGTGVAHVFNSWEAMPPVGEQLAMPGSQTNPALVAARFLLKPGRRYEEAVKTFQPYDKTKEVNGEARKAGATLIAEGVKAKGRRDLHLRQQPAGGERALDDRGNGGPGRIARGAGLRGRGWSWFTPWHRASRSNGLRQVTPPRFRTWV